MLLHRFAPKTDVAWQHLLEWQPLDLLRGVVLPVQQRAFRNSGCVGLEGFSVSLLEGSALVWLHAAQDLREEVMSFNAHKASHAGPSTLIS